MSKGKYGPYSKENKAGKYTNNTPIDDAFIDQSLLEYYNENTFDNSEKHERFIQAANECLNQILDKLVALRRLADTEEYEYKPGEIASIFDEIENGIKTAKTAYLLEGTNISLYQHRYDSKDWPIICIETREVFTSIPKASLFTGINGGNISSAVHDKLKTAGGYHWEYHKPMLRYLPTKEFRKKWENQKIIDSNDGTIYTGVIEAASKTKIAEDLIYEAILNNKPYYAESSENKLKTVYMHINNHTFQRICNDSNLEK